VSLGGRVLSAVGTIVTIPLVLNHLGPERYGLWVTLSVIFVYLRLADGGATIGLISLVALADGAHDQSRVRALFSSAFAVTAIVAVGLTGLACATPLLDWQRLLKFSTPQLVTEATAACAIIVLSLAVGYPAGVVRQGRLGLQQGAAANAWDLAGTVLMFAGQLVVVYFKLGLVALAAVTALMPVAMNVVSSVLFLATTGKAYRPRPALVNSATIRALMTSGSMFMALMLTQALSVQIDTVLIARLLGVEAVSDYSVVQKLLTQPQFITTMLLTAQFPAYSEALARGDHAWIVEHFRTTLLGAVALAAGACAVLGLLAGPLLALWIGSAIQTGPLLLWSMAVYGTVATIANVFTYTFFALGLYRRVILAHAAMIAINIPASIVLIPRVGSAGACIATTIGYVAALIIPSLLGLRGVLARLPTLRDKAMKRADMWGETT
jgi:O-antigen/teichoic acid export membrane protein